MGKRVPVGDGTYCYTVNCSLHGVRHQAQELMTDPTGEWSAYYTATERKHFRDPTLPGSKFTHPPVKTLIDLLETVHTQRGDWEGDDREVFISLGADPEAFKPGYRYLFVAIPGKLGVINSNTLPEDTTLEVVRTKPGAPGNFVHHVTHQPETMYGVVILEDEPSGPRLITAFPGSPTYVPDVREDTGEHYTEQLIGTTVTVKQIRDQIGRDFTVHTFISA